MKKRKKKKKKGIAVLVNNWTNGLEEVHETFSSDARYFTTMIRGLNELVSGNISDSQYITYMTSKYEEQSGGRVYLPVAKDAIA